jgi:hypothetical protein
MVVLEFDQVITFGGASGPAAFVTLSSIGKIDDEVCPCFLLKTFAGLVAVGIYVGARIRGRSMLGLPVDLYVRLPDPVACVAAHLRAQHNLTYTKKFTETLVADLQ